jgi:hypothetical protein
MTRSIDEREMLGRAWRFAHVLTGCAAGASKAFAETVTEVLRHPHADDPDRVEQLFFALLRRRSLRFPAVCELDGLVSAVHRLAEPARSALLLRAGGFPDVAIGRILDVTPVLLKGALDEARGALPEGVDAEVITASVAGLAVGADGERSIEAATAKLSDARQGVRRSAYNPATLAVGVGFLLLVGVLVWNFLGRAGAFPEEALKIATEGISAAPEQFDPVEERAGAIGDWFMLKGFDGFRVPPGLEQANVVGVRMFKFENETVASALVLENQMYLFAFRGGPLGVSVTPEKTWRITETKRNVLALREEGGYCFMIAFRGTAEDMRRFLAGLRSLATEGGIDAAAMLSRY